MDPRPGQRWRGRTGKFQEGVVDDLLDYAKFVVGQEEPDGETQHQRVLAQQARDDPELAVLLKKHVVAARQAATSPPIPPAGEHLWRWYCAISAPRNSNGFGITEVGWSDIDAWERRYGIRLQWWECHAIVLIDAEVRHAIARRSAARSETKPQQR